ncbi:MAG: 16S rRNA (adenine(1518)-N(6)/adenine(1519)-N(6))-dimethyltransferase RsmA [Brevinematales bacterium]|nr:16S rRNA (adenine(1518)-N(6)/adenine(1519)-N(6))-dimethyltransferase RsmA [Brevinematales bacterium]
MDIYSPKGIIDILEKNKLYLSSSRGQNYLFDKNVVNKIVKSIRERISKDKTILEVGSGIGSITIPLAANFSKVITVEIDRGISNVLKNIVVFYNFQEKIEIINGDFLKLSPQDIIGEIKDVVFVSNLPYNVGGEILKKVFYEYPIKDIFVMVQKEFFERLTAKSSNENYSFLSVITQLNSEIIEKLFSVGRGSFFPSPSVDSVLVYIRKKNFLLAQDSVDFIKLLFANRRKNILNSIRIATNLERDLIEEILSKFRIPKYIRIEDLSPKDIYELSKSLIDLKRGYNTP